MYETNKSLLFKGLTILGNENRQIFVHLIQQKCRLGIVCYCLNATGYLFNFFDLKNLSTELA